MIFEWPPTAHPRRCRRVPGRPPILVTDAGDIVLDTGDCAGFKAGECNGHHVQNRGEATAVVLEIGTRGQSEPHAEYPDIDLRVTAQGYVHKDGTPYTSPPARRRTHGARLGRGQTASSRSDYGAISPLAPRFRFVRELTRYALPV